MMHGHTNAKCNEYTLLHVQMRQIEILKIVVSTFIGVVPGSDSLCVSACTVDYREYCRDDRVKDVSFPT
jgi:hypothetical protein